MVRNYISRNPHETVENTTFKLVTVFKGQYGYNALQPVVLYWKERYFVRP